MLFSSERMRYPVLPLITYSSDGRVIRVSRRLVSVGGSWWLSAGPRSPRQLPPFGDQPPADSKTMSGTISTSALFQAAVRVAALTKAVERAESEYIKRRIEAMAAAMRHQCRVMLTAADRPQQFLLMVPQAEGPLTGCPVNWSAVKTVHGSCAFDFLTLAAWTAAERHAELAAAAAVVDQLQVAALP
eukprot:GDKI01001918.1.p1 GENE.GDKI01001918.1~~GDKI01001918.1.p1  ORF type:complete len:187 (+),score=30.04 GDKI01001918.1:59-619(+)